MSSKNTKDTTTITSIDDAPEAALGSAEASPTVPVTDNLSVFGGDSAELIVQSNAAEGILGQQAVFVGINGYGFNIPRDKKVIVPVEVIENLDNASVVVIEGLDNGQTRERTVKRFAYSVRYLPSAK